MGRKRLKQKVFSLPNFPSSLSFSFSLSQLKCYNHNFGRTKATGVILNNMHAWKITGCSSFSIYLMTKWILSWRSGGCHGNTWRLSLVLLSPTYTVALQLEGTGQCSHGIQTQLQQWWLPVQSQSGIWHYSLGLCERWYPCHWQPLSRHRQYANNICMMMKATQEADRATTVWVFLVFTFLMDWDDGGFLPYCRNCTILPWFIEELKECFPGFRSKVFDHVICDTIWTWCLLAFQLFNCYFSLFHGDGLAHAFDWHGLLLQLS